MDLLFYPLVLAAVLLPVIWVGRRHTDHVETLAVAAGYGLSKGLHALEGLEPWGRGDPALGHAGPPVGRAAADQGVAPACGGLSRLDQSGNRSQPSALRSCGALLRLVRPFRPGARLSRRNGGGPRPPLGRSYRHHPDAALQPGWLTRPHLPGGSPGGLSGIHRGRGLALDSAVRVAGSAAGGRLGSCGHRARRPQPARPSYHHLRVIEGAGHILCPAGARAVPGAPRR